jgi:hypothetical protein
MLEFFIDNIFVMFGGQSAYRWVHTVLLLFLYSYDAYFIQRLLKKNEKKLAQSLRCRSRYEANISVSVVSFISSSMG